METAVQTGGKAERRAYGSQVCFSFVVSPRSAMTEGAAWGGEHPQAPRDVGEMPNAPALSHWGPSHRPLQGSGLPRQTPSLGLLQARGWTRGHGESLSGDIQNPSGHAPM